MGNTDNHIKNVSILYSEDLKSLKLAPAYDIVSTMIYDSCTDQMALSIGGMYSIYQISRECFEREAKALGLGSGIVMQRFDAMVLKFRAALDEACVQLKASGFYYVDEIRQSILLKGGIRSCIF